jgi:hypothetical protein
VPAIGPDPSAAGSTTWHSIADDTVAYRNFNELMEQWTDVTAVE